MSTLKKYYLGYLHSITLRLKSNHFVFVFSRVVINITDFTYNSINIAQNTLQLSTEWLNFISDPIIGYSGEETSGLESSFTSPSVHKDFIDQYLNKLSYLPGDVITNSEPGSSFLSFFLSCLLTIANRHFKTCFHQKLMLKT